jgi:hypothetical protein
LVDHTHFENYLLRAQTQRTMDHQVQGPAVHGPV